MALTGFTGAYATSSWTLTKNSSTNQLSTTLQKNDGSFASLDGDVDTFNAVSGSIDLYGSNTNSGNSSNTDWTIPVTSAGTVSFDWSYFSQDTAGNDIAGYLLNGTFNVLATTDGQFSTLPVTFSVSSGNTFGFRVLTTNNTGGQGIFTVNNFNVQVVPWEFSPTMGLGILGLNVLYRQWRQRQIKH
jgi:hypothetical protein